MIEKHTFIEVLELFKQGFNLISKGLEKIIHRLKSEDVITQK